MYLTFPSPCITSFLLQIAAPPFLSSATSLWRSAVLCCLGVRVGATVAGGSECRGASFQSND